MPEIGGAADCKEMFKVTSKQCTLKPWDISCVYSMVPSYVITQLASEYILVWAIQGSLILENDSWQQAGNLAFLVS